MWCFILNRWLMLPDTSHFKYSSELHHFGCPKIRKYLVFKENHQLLWLLPQQILILDVAAFCQLWKERASNCCKDGTGNTCCVIRYIVVGQWLGRQNKREGNMDRWYCSIPTKTIHTGVSQLLAVLLVSVRAACSSAYWFHSQKLIAD